jgi:catechol 2,3-dioxygenase-like lactoylglutathione lyase family enzyme
MQRLSAVAFLVREYDEAIEWLTHKLDFELIEDTRIDEHKRWVVVAARGSQCRLVLARAVGDSQQAAIGHQAGGRVFLFLETDDFDRDYERMRSSGVRFCEEPRSEKYGRVVVFEDLYGNRWDLLES